MGRETTCNVQWGRESGNCKVLLETNDLIVRGIGRNPVRRTVPIASLTQVEARGGQLCFRVNGEEVNLALGADQAQSWARKIATPPPTLAKKLGVTPATHLSLVGEFDTEELRTVVAQAASTGSKTPDQILAIVKTRADLNHALDLYTTDANNPPVWIIYPKGPNKPIGETEIRSTLRHEGFIDTKVASVSATLTGLRFIKRESEYKRS
jgi:hypothetical protein